MTKQEEHWARTLDYLNDWPIAKILGTYQLTTLENFVMHRREEMKADILKVLKRKHVWIETGEDVCFDRTFFDHYININQDLKMFINMMKSKTLSTNDIEIIYNKMVAYPEFKLKTTHP